MSLEVYPANFSTRYEISHAISIQMSVNYNDIGKIQLVVVVDDYNINALKTGNFIYDTVRKATYIIVNTKCDSNTNKLTANGYTVDYLLNKRVVATKRKITTIETGVYATIRDNLRGLPRITLAAAKGLKEKYQGDDKTTEDVDESQVYGGQLLNVITDVLNYGELGRRMVWDESLLSWMFEIYKGRDLTTGIHRVVFAEEQGTCENLVINVDWSTFKNAAYLIYKYNDKEYLLDIGSSENEKRYELWINSSISNEEDETLTQTKKRAKASAQSELKQHIKRQSFSVTIDADELDDRFSIGDIVACASTKYQISFTARITGVKYTLDSTGEHTEILLGDPTLTALGELKLNG